MNSDAVAWLFPGQGAHAPSMLDGLRQCDLFAEYYGLVCDLLCEDPLKTAERAPDSMNRNAVSSLVTVITSCLCLDILRRSSAIPCASEPLAAAGYSVGQWTALYAADTVDLETLLRTVKRRADIMDECIAEVPSGMLGVIGLKLDQLETVCAQAVDNNLVLEISNHNSMTQYSLAGTEKALAFAEPRLAEMKPKVVRRLPVAGAWHTSLLRPAAREFSKYLEGVHLNPVQIPVISNVTGSWLPDTESLLRKELAEQVAKPVLWAEGVRKVISCGVSNCIEVGFGDMLTRFGMFLDRSVKHNTFYIPPAVKA